MKSIEAFYAAFERAGMLVPATWQSARVGAQPVTASVRFIRQSLRTLDGEALGYQSQMLIPAALFDGIAPGDRVFIQPEPAKPAVIEFQVNELELITGGSQRAVSLKKV